MKPMTCDEIRRAVRGRWLSTNTPTTINRISIDTRTAGSGEMFVALEGERFDGHDFLNQAGLAGCTAAIVKQNREIDPAIVEVFTGGLIGVEDTTVALGDLGAFNRTQVPATVVAITGSNGKTTVKWMVDHILAKNLTGCCSPKSFNNSIGVPLTLLDIDISDEYAICEVGTSAPGEIAALGRLVKPDIAVITSVSAAHLEGLGGVDKVALEKASLVSCLGDNGLAIVFGDSELLGRLVDSQASRVVRFGRGDQCELRLTGYKVSGGGQSFQLNDYLWVDLLVAGRHNAFNALAAIAVAQRMGIDQGLSAAALADFQPVEVRLPRIDAGGVSIINDAYNANPASMLAAANVLAETPGTRRVLVAGDMLELGDQARQLHRQSGQDISELGIEMVVSVGKLASCFAEAASAAGLIGEAFDTVESATKHLPDLLQTGDVVLIKGSRSMQMERLVEPIRSAFALGESAKSRRAQL